MELSDKAEDLLAWVWMEQVEKGKPFDPVTFRADAASTELVTASLATVDDAVTLTETGTSEAREFVRRHRLAERLLADVLDIDPKKLHDSGSKMSHALRKEVVEHICVLLGHPTTCPHGRPIPPGECCARMEHVVESLTLPLSSMDPGTEGVIAYLKNIGTESLRTIMAIGALPGLKITLARNFPSYVFQIGESQFAVDKQIADAVIVRKSMRKPKKRRGRWGQNLA